MSDLSKKAADVLTREDIEKAIKKLHERSFTEGTVYMSSEQFQGLKEMLRKEERLEKIKKTPLWKVING